MIRLALVYPPRVHLWNIVPALRSGLRQGTMYAQGWALFPGLSRVNGDELRGLDVSQVNVIDGRLVLESLKVGARFVAVVPRPSLTHTREAGRVQYEYHTLTPATGVEPMLN